jgi:hypothetical protein
MAVKVRGWRRTGAGALLDVSQSTVLCIRKIHRLTPILEKNNIECDSLM